MYYSPYQQKQLRYLGLAKIFYHKDMFTKKKELGYTFKDSPYDQIHIADDISNDDIKKIVILHEVGHILYGHNDVDIKKELIDVKNLFEKMGVPYKKIMCYGGPMLFENVAMDLEVNSKLLTIANTRDMENFGWKLCTCKGFNIKVGDSFRDYYEPLIERLKNDNSNNSENSNGEEADKGNGEGVGIGGSSGSGSGSGNSNGGSGNDGSNPFNDLSAPPMFDMDLPEEIRDALLDEDYKSASEDNSYDNCTSDTVDSAINNDKDGLDVSDGASSEKNNTIGNSSRTDFKASLESGDASKAISKWLHRIVKINRKSHLDSMKIYNRGTQPNPYGILYRSVKTDYEHRKCNFSVLVDVSGSMETDDVLTAVKTLSDEKNNLGKDSYLVTWNWSRVEEFPITEIPKEVQIGGGTDMASGAKYLIEKKNADIVVIYSDFETDLDKLIELVKKYDRKVKFYSIGVKCSTRLLSSEKFKEYLSYNKSFLQLN